MGAPAEGARRTAGRGGDPQDGDAVPGRDCAAGGGRRRDADGRGGPGGVRQCATGEAAGKGTTQNSPGTGGVRQLAAGAGLWVAAGFIAAEEPPPAGDRKSI